MPRICTSTGEPLDFCDDCFPLTEEKAFKEFGDMGDGPDGRGNCFEYEPEHPSYETGEYRCHECGCELNDDNA